MPYDMHETVPTQLVELAAIREWGAIPATSRFAMLSKIRRPTLIVHGNKDVAVKPINAFLLVEHLPNAQLIMYPDASHGARSQHAEVSAAVRQINPVGIKLVLLAFAKG
jgi:pimeloyl-ACP methyl ester carboxylesterase